ncbi:MAG: hypothetical protein GY816_09610 [Cytophagales bacterium]|nr:hypothetical protein [Cytophagales bacterium]
MNKKLWPNKQFRNSLIVNHTDVTFSEAELDILALGPNFALFPRKVPVSDFVAGVEPSLRNFPNGGQAIAASVSRLLRTAIKLTHPNLSENHRRALMSIRRKLKSHHTILLPADKGAKTVVMPRTEYLTKMEEHLNNNSLYEKQRRNCNPITRARKMLKPLLESFDCSTTVLLSEQTAIVPTPYGLPKIHKHDYPLRMIVPMVGTVSYHLSKQLDRLLRPVVDSLEFRIQSGDHLLQKLSLLDNPNTMFMGSLDVVALFPNVNISYLLGKLPTLLKERAALWRNKDLPLGHLSAENVVSLLKGICDSTFFKFDGTFYKQLNGVPMGSPVSVCLSELFMHFIESEALATCQAEVLPLYYGRYIDDILIISPTAQSFTGFHNHINNGQNLISFTKEEELSQKLPFLDIVLSRENGHFEFSVYRKKTHSNRYCHPSSAVPHSVLAGTIRNMRLRAQKYCSTQENFVAELATLGAAFRNNNYNNRILHHHLTTPIYGPRLPHPIPTAKIVLPFVGKTSYKIRNLLSNIGVNVYFKSPIRTGSMLYKKFVWQKNSPLDQSNVVYRVRCSDCPAVYIGETKRTLRTRGAEHLSNIRASNINHSALGPVSST